MNRRDRAQRSETGQGRSIWEAIPGKLFLLLPLLLVIAIPPFLYGTGLGAKILPATTDFISKLTAPAPPATPTPQPAFLNTLPQVGSIRYTVQEGDNCVSILAYAMNMVNAGEVFSDAEPKTVAALNASLGKDCHKLQPGMVLPLSPHYPLMAFGGRVLKITGASKQQVAPTPLIKITQEAQTRSDCSEGCILLVQIAPDVRVELTVKTILDIGVGSWVWTQAMMQRKAVPGFDKYPYVDPKASINGMKLSACELQVDQTRDTSSPTCSSLMPNTIEQDQGAWLLSVTGQNALDHWRYRLKKQAPGTRLLLWLSLENEKLVFRPGNPVYRYNESTQIYEKVS